MKKLHSGTGMAYADNLSADECFTGFIQKQKSVLHRCNINMDTLGQPFGLDVDSNRGQAHLHQAHGKPQQKPCSDTNVPLLKGGRILKTKKQICK